MNPKIDPEQDYYAILHVEEEASDEAIKQAYRELARRYHPDSGGDVEAFRQVQEAYEILRDGVFRRAYDRQRAARGFGADAPLTLEITLSQQELRAMEVAQMLYLLAEIKPVGQISARQQSLNLALVVDRSTSMRGQRMENVKQAAHNLVEALDVEDRLAIVAFSDRAEVLAPSTTISDRAALHSALARMVPGGGTEIFQGLLAGLTEVRRYARANTLDHVILLTDGRTYGDEDLALAESKRANQEGITISAMGIGEDWNDLFLDRLARYGNGVSEYIKSSSQLETLLCGQIQKLESVIARDTKLHLKPAPAVSIESLHRVVPYIEGLEVPSDGVVNLGHLGTESIVLVLELVVKEPHGGTHRLLRADLEARNGAERTPVHVRKDVCVDVVVGPASPDTSVPARVLNFLSRMSVFRLQERAWHALEAGRSNEATHLLESAATRLFDLGYQDLARAALVEAERVARGDEASQKGRKTVRYGTRSLTLT